VIAKLLVANRGEIAARVLRTARAMGIATVAVCSDPDRDAPWLALADEAVAIGGAAPADSYLRVDAVLEAAERTGADAVHPGYGFLAERPELAEGCRKRGLTFVGPPPEVLAALGDKREARRVAATAGVPVLEGVSLGGLAGLAGRDLAAEAGRVGFPLVVKAASGGGGIGMRVVRGPAELAGAVEAASRLAGAAFGDDEVFLERWLEAPRHVEVQIVADAAGRMVHLFERECSIQRRHQKLVEEAPSPAVGPELREGLGEAALAVAGAVGYVGAGTVEFLLDGSGAFWFLEVNARIQVEHPVTEAVTGLDLVRLQLQAAAGQPLPPELSRVEPRGHAVEARLYAEDPAAGFLPQAGVLHRFRVGDGPGVRVDAGVADGSVVGVHYDPLLAKVTAHAPTREEAARVLAAALASARLHGVVTNRDLLVGVLRSAAFLSGETDTAFLDRHPPAELATAGGPADPEATRLHAAAAALAAQAERRATTPVYPAVPSGWRNNPSQLQRTDLEITRPPGPATVSVAYRFDRTGALEVLEVDGAPLPTPRLWHCAPDLVDLEVDGIRRHVEVHRVADTWFVDSPLGHAEFRAAVGSGPGAAGSAAPGAAVDAGSAPASGSVPASSPAAAAPGAPAGGLWTAGSPDPGDGLPSRLGPPAPAGGVGPGPDQARDDVGLPSGPGLGVQSGSAGSRATDGGDPPGAGDGVAVAPLPGVVRRVVVGVGDRVEAGAVLVVMEAMKTEHPVAAGRGGTVRRVLVAEGQEVAAGAVVVELEGPADG
jgi:propionyl-CoA carboxylase alpha chain